MAVYYGYGNVPYAAEALVSLNREKLFNLDQKNEVRTLALRLKNRILNLMRFEDRVVDNIDYNNLALIALQTIQDEFNLPE